MRRLYTRFCACPYSSTYSKAGEDRGVESGASAGEGVSLSEPSSLEVPGDGSGVGEGMTSLGDALDGRGASGEVKLLALGKTFASSCRRVVCKRANLADCSSFRSAMLNCLASTDSRLRTSSRGTIGRRKGPNTGIAVVSSPRGVNPLALILDWAPTSGFPPEVITLWAALDKANSKLARVAICSALREVFNAEATSISERPIEPNSGPRRGTKIGPMIGIPFRMDVRVSRIPLSWKAVDTTRRGQGSGA